MTLLSYIMALTAGLYGVATDPIVPQGVEKVPSYGIDMIGKARPSKDEVGYCVVTFRITRNGPMVGILTLKFPIDHVLCDIEEL